MTLQPQKPKPRRISACHRHPTEPVTGFCALCLRERLSGLDSPSSAAATTGSVILSTAANAVSSSFQPELRRCKSYAARKCGASSGAIEPRRKSCDDRARKNTLWHLFSLDDEGNCMNKGSDVESKNLGFSEVAGSVIEGGDNIRVSEDAFGENVIDNEPYVEDFAEEETRTMKEHIELEWQSTKPNRKDLKDIAGSFLLAASVFSQKLRKWRLKQTTKKQTHGGGGDLVSAEKVNHRKSRETQSEVGEYTYGRRSCDTDPRFSVDVNRISLDDHPRFSFDEPRASWDGYMIARTIPRLAPMLSVIENAMINENETTSGGSAQTRDYCSDSSSSHRQNSFDCSSSGKSSSKKTVAVEVDDMKSIKFVVTDGETRDEEHMESFESGCKTATSIAGGSETNGFKKSGTWRKGWNVLGFIHRHDKHGKAEGNGNGHTIRYCSEKQNGEGNGVVINGDPIGDEGNGVVINEGPSWKLVRSGSVSSRSPYKTNSSYHRSLSVAETRDYAKKNKEESVLERNRNGMMYSPSPSNLDNGLLRFHLTPSWSHRKKSGRSRLRNSDSITRSVFG